MKRLWYPITLLSFSLAFLGALSAKTAMAYQTYSSALSFLGAISEEVEDYDGLALNDEPPFDLPFGDSLQAEATGSGILLKTSGGYRYINTGSIVFTLNDGIGAFGFEILQGRTVNIDVTLYNNSGYSLDIFSYSGSDFWGVIKQESDDPFKYIQIVSNSLEENSDIGTLYAAGVEDITPDAVPIPAAVWLLGSGLMGLATLRRLRRAG